MRIILTSILCMALLCAGHTQAADTEIISDGKADGKFLFRVNGVVVVASEGDIIDGCKVTRNGLDCKGAPHTLSPKDGGLTAAAQKLRREKEQCEDELTRAGQSCHERYQANILDFTEALKKKNYELAEKTKEIEGLKADLARGDRVIGALRNEGPASLPPGPAPEVTPAASAPIAADKNVRGILASLETPAGNNRRETATAQNTAEKTQGVKPGAKPAVSAKSATLAPVDVEFVVIRRNWSNLRTEPNAEAAVESQGLTGDIFPVITKSREGWYQVILDNGGLGWVAEDVVSPASPSPKPVTAATSATMKREGHLRAAANPISDLLAVVPAGESLTLLEQTRNWLKVSRPDGREGWIHRSTARVVE